MSEPYDLHAAAFEAVQRWWQAWVERDSKVVAQMADDDYTERNDMGRLKSLGSRRLIEILSQGCNDCVITKWGLSDPVTRVFEHSIVCSYAFRFEGKRGSQSFVYQGRATDVLNQKDDAWILVSHEGVLESGRPVH